MKPALCENIHPAMEVDLGDHSRVCKLIYIGVLFEYCSFYGYSEYLHL